MAQTVMAVMEASAAKGAALPALRTKNHGQWQTTTWAEYRAETRLVARALMALGLGPKEGVIIIAENCHQWFIGNIAAIYSGAIPVGIYTTSSPEQCQYIAENCDARIAIVDNSAQLAKLKAIAEQLPKLRAIVMIKGGDSAEHIHSWDELPELAEHVSEQALDERIKARQPEDICTLIYTSGTTGKPKGVMLSHSNLTWMAQNSVETYHCNSDERIISYLPLSHIAEQIFSLYIPLYCGGCTSFAESLGLLGNNLREVRPTSFVAVPRVWEKIQSKMLIAGNASPPLRKKVVAWARNLGLAGGYALQQNRTPPLFYKLAERLVFSKIRRELGFDRCRNLLSSAAPISIDTLEFFLSLGLPICEIYGMSECSGPATVGLANNYHTDKLGLCLPGAEMRIAQDGEILMRGPHIFAGYIKNEAATRAAIDSDGWLHTEDIGTIDSHGFLQVTARKKDLIITSSGENIAPQLLEGKIKALSAVSQVVVIGDQRKYLTALITLDPETLDSTLGCAGSQAMGLEAAAQCKQLQGYLQQQINAINKNLAQVQSIKKFTILADDFSIAGDELTPTMKIKRNIVSLKYQAQISAMY
ncbi:MAG: AMP-binding protein [Gammaproteobacteria bacterium]|nr:AMP-binding protein [Gammaproteobacteria bacterium]MBQ0841153.1 AMP-binding protein [Gammaproteobacteria bacterium]